MTGGSGKFFMKYAVCFTHLLWLPMSTVSPQDDLRAQIKQAQSSSGLTGRYASACLPWPRPICARRPSPARPPVTMLVGCVSSPHPHPAELTEPRQSWLSSLRAPDIAQAQNPRPLLRVSRAQHTAGAQWDQDGAGLTTEVLKKLNNGLALLGSKTPDDLQG